MIIILLFKEKMTEVKFVEISKGYLVRLDDIISVQKINGQYPRISTSYFSYFSHYDNGNVVKKSVSYKDIKLDDNAILYHKLLKYFFNE